MGGRGRHHVVVIGGCTGCGSDFFMLFAFEVTFNLYSIFDLSSISVIHKSSDEDMDTDDEIEAVRRMEKEEEEEERRKRRSLRFANMKCRFHFTMDQQSL